MGNVTKSHDPSAKKFQNEGGNFATTQTIQTPIAPKF
jgi:hypothetical protein